MVHDFVLIAIGLGCALFVLVFFLTFSPAYAHPDFVGAKIQWANHTEIPHSINVITKSSVLDIDYF